MYAGVMLKAIRQWVYPPHCAACGVPLEDGLLCQACTMALNVPFVGHCRQCGVVHAGARCQACAACDLIDDAATAGVYADPLATLIQNFKYRGDQALLKVLVPRLREASRHLAMPDAVTFVPMTRRRQRQRGFNQAALLAQAVACAYGLPLMNLLQKVRHTAPQASLSQAQRHLNVNDAFGARTADVRSLWLVDDVRTTGATLKACAAVLKATGVRQVQTLVLAVASG